MKNELIKLATYLDSKGYYKEANYLDNFIKNASHQDRMIEERNCMMDRRTNATNAWEGFDPKSNTIAISWTKYNDNDEEEEVTLNLPAKFEVCDLCGGKGTTVNPSIDAGGLSSEDFDEDPGFREDYLGGAYDISCPQCGGKRVVPTVNFDGLNIEQKKEFDEYQREQEEAARDAEADRKTYMAEMGYGW
jgi:hypothetical protein